MSVGAVSAGQLRHRVTIQKNGATTRNEYGELQPATWVDVGKAWCRVTPKRGTEATDADRTEERITHDVVMQYREGVTAAMRVVWQNAVLNIRHVQDFAGMHRGMLLLCEQDAGEVAA
jgi:SPP1 family predicted phage head-tail adaptor